MSDSSESQGVGPGLLTLAPGDEVAVVWPGNSVRRSHVNRVGARVVELTCGTIWRRKDGHPHPRRLYQGQHIRPWLESDVENCGRNVRADSPELIAFERGLAKQQSQRSIAEVLGPLPSVDDLMAERDQLRARVAELERDRNDLLARRSELVHEKFTETIATAKTEERAAVVAWLSDRNAVYPDYFGPHKNSYGESSAADAIERGEHVKGGG